jgi:hypothetical protein
MEKILILVNTGVPAVIAGIIPMLQASLLEATAQTHGVILIAKTSVPTLMELTVTTTIPIMKMDHTALPTVGQIPQVNTVQLVLEVMMHQATGTKYAMKLEMVTRVPQKELSRKILGKLM